MAIEQKFTDLINADIDGDISEAEKAELQAFLSDNAEGRALRDELAALTDALDGVEQEAPPPYMRHIIMNSVPPTGSKQESPGFLQILFATPALKYAVTFAAGVFLTLSMLNSNEISNQTFDNVTGLVGTVAEPVDTTFARSVTLSETDIAGTVSLRNAGSLMILDFNLVSADQIEVQADYTDKTIWFNGFAQLESEGTTVSAETGRVQLHMEEGKRRYAVYLQNRGARSTTVSLRFMADGKVVHQAKLEYSPGH